MPAYPIPQTGGTGPAGPLSPIKEARTLLAQSPNDLVRAVLLERSALHHFTVSYS